MHLRLFLDSEHFSKAYSLENVHLHGLSAPGFSGFESIHQPRGRGGGVEQNQRVNQNSANALSPFCLPIKGRTKGGGGTWKLPGVLDVMVVKKGAWTYSRITSRCHRVPPL